MLHSIVLKVPFKHHKWQLMIIEEMIIKEMIIEEKENMDNY